MSLVVLRRAGLALTLAACGNDANDAAGMRAVCGAPAAALPVQTFDALATDATRGRDVGFRIQYAPGFDGCMPIVLVSHGGAGGPAGYLTLAHLGNEYAARGYLAVHVNHLASVTDPQHLVDAPRDVSFLLDRLAAGTLPLPVDLKGTIDRSRVGVAGQSWGAYVAHALGGGSFGVGDLRDARVRAIVPISPQGPGQLSAFDRGADDNSWRTVVVPTYSLVGTLEKDASYGDVPPVTMTDWRLYPYLRYPTSPDRFLSLLADQDHVHMNDEGSTPVKSYIATNTRIFFDAYLRGDASARCAVGKVSLLTGTENRTTSNCP